jgi:hypothetical protein
VSGPDLVVFADIGSAWLVGEGPGRLRSDRLPVFGSFETDLGIGLDSGPLGLYMAKGISGRNQPVRFSLRLGRRC